MEIIYTQIYYNMYIYLQQYHNLVLSLVLRCFVVRFVCCDVALALPNRDDVC